MDEARSAEVAVRSNRVFASAGSRRLLLSLALFAGTLLFYRPVQGYGFVNFDDPEYVTKNVPVQNGLSWRNLRWAFTTTQASNWHPLTWLSHMADDQLYGLNPAGHHFTSVLLHGLNVVLLFLVLQAATGYLGRSSFVAAVFAVHPLNVQSVAWISERKNVLSTTFLLLTLLAYGWYALRPGLRRYLAVAAAFVLGLMAKPMLVTLPLALLLLDYWPLFRLGRPRPSDAHGPGLGASALTNRIPRASPRLLLGEKLPLLVISFMSSWITYRVQRVESMDLIAIIPWRMRIPNALYSYGWYLLKTLWPTQLCIFYPHPFNTLSWLPVGTATLALVAITIATVLNARGKPYLLVGWLWFLGTLVPVIGLVQVGVQARADRYAYVPLMGLLVALAWWSAQSFSEVRQRAATVVALIALVPLGLDARQQMAYWHDSVSLFSHALEVAPVNNYMSHATLANALMLEGRCAEARPHFLLVLQHFPAAGTVREDFAQCLRDQGRFQESIEQEKLVLVAAGNDPAWTARIHTAMAMTEMQEHDFRAAEADLRLAIRIDPDSFEPHLGLGILLAKLNRPAEALAELSHSVALSPSSDGYLKLGEVLQQQGRPADALAAYQHALKLSPASAEIQRRMDALRGQGATK
jgi:protein O-mannosyl-transferase